MQDSTNFAGMYVQAVDAKGRVAIPAPFREAIDARFDRMIAEGGDFEDVAAQREQVFNYWERANFDPGGRFNLPDFYRSERDIDGSALFTGGGPTFNIWSPEVYIGHADNPDQLRRRVEAMLNAKARG